MPGNRKNPVDGSMIIAFGELQADAKVVGLAVGRIKELLVAELPEFATLPLDAEAQISTMDPDDETWTQIQAEQHDSMVTSSMEGGLQIFQAVSKTVPDSYVTRKADIYLRLTPCKR